MILRQQKRRTVILLLLCFTVMGCRSGVRGMMGGDHGCQGAACGVPLVNNHGDETTPAELFAAMNYEEIAVEQLQESRQAERVAAIPNGPDSLFAAIR